MGKQSAPAGVIISAPTNLDEATKVLGHIGQRLRSIEDAERRMNERIERIKQPYIGRVTADEAELNQLVEVLYAYAHANRETLTVDSKTVKLPTGTISWKLSPQAIELLDEEEVVVARFEALEMPRFVRTKKELDKEQALKEPKVIEGVEGIAIIQRENFVIKPSQTSLTVNASFVENALAVKRDKPKKTSADKPVKEPKRKSPTKDLRKSHPR